VVAWALTITDLDPLALGLLFERFLNPERVSMPDFDIDFCETRRGEVIRYVQQKYGAIRSRRSSPSESSRRARC
jgi:DNA polymerase-3 subunit alpha